MRDFAELFDFKGVVKCLITYRSKVAFYLHKNSYLDCYLPQTPFTITDEDRKNEIEKLKNILPPRKEWSRPKSHSRRAEYESTIDLNQVSIQNRVFQVHRQFLTGELEFLETPNWYQNLRKFIFDLRIRVFFPDYFIVTPPKIFPAKKPSFKKEDFERRPIAKFLLEDKIVLSIVNNYLTKLFDTIFLDCSFAFRNRNTQKKGPTYHDAVKSLQEFAIKRSDTPLYVSECDIKKFFDCVDQEKVLLEYHKLKELLVAKGFKIDSHAEKVFIGYLNCYSFNKDVYPLNFNTNYWISTGDDHGQFGWVDEYKMPFSVGTLDQKRIGIPQGGALSGLIVNILMHDLDTAITSQANGNEYPFYLRYCDDMVIVHESAEECKNLFLLYFKKLFDLNLIPHVPADLKLTYCKEFWKNDIKSRNVYHWSNKKDNVNPHSPWISFLGYMVNVNGDLKIRKKSLEKQMIKHERELSKVIRRLQKHANIDLINIEKAIIQSFETKLSSMAVGSIDISNYKTSEAKMCWGAGFRLLDDNKFTRSQLKALDLSRQKAISKLKIYLKKREIEHISEDGQVPKTDYLKPGYPHSFYSLLERSKTF
jgi:hypothetical protein